MASRAAGAAVEGLALLLLLVWLALRLLGVGERQRGAREACMMRGFGSFGLAPGGGEWLWLPRVHSRVAAERAMPCC